MTLKYDYIVKVSFSHDKSKYLNERNELVFNLFLCKETTCPIELFIAFHENDWYVKTVFML